ncbi:hypothetical protein, conserved [Babesia bigemina]|uniref:C3H1-type domain-containing protein n=1 Tax=Babesia bigemina TaxID=5866 RepID=A0A061BJ42_BABBI|nr:hypothetical protein, conserved [Babesia bigemina]CDR71496.1 hypothetical protein, conserved [Babesia bigemina]|eukprot:XP_012770442.1 hypothetical protein, conserved [Babesia bigemina]
MTSLNHHNNLCLVTLHFPPSTACHCPDHVPLRELGKKFGKILNLKNTSNNNTNNILNNLCSGLEKFLGFNSETKGYDGTGIVYSDLDRLCDGVMGFLYYVLKDVSEKQPYSVGKSILKEFVETELKPKLSTGREGFKVIEQLAGKVREYNDKVKTSNDYVKNKIKEMHNHVDKTLTDKLRSILLNDDSDLRKALTQQQVQKVEQAVTEAERLVKDYATKGTDFINGFREKKVFSYRKGTTYEYRDEFKDLNPDVQQKINNAIQNISYEATRLGALSAKEQNHLEQMTATIKDTFSSLNRCVNDKIGTDVTALVSNIVKQVDGILKSLQAIDKELWKHVNELGKWINTADEIVRDGINRANGIENKGVGSVNKDNIDNVVKNINTVFYGAKDFVKQNVEEAIKAVAKMDEELKKDLFTVKTQIEKSIDLINVSIAALGGKFSEITDRNKISGIIGHIEKQVAKVAGSGLRSESGLGAIKHILIAFIWRYKSEKFAAKMNELVGEIMRTDPVKGHLKQYVSSNKGQWNTYFKPDTTADSITLKVQEEIMKEITKVITEPELTGDSVESHLNVLNQNMLTFSQKLQNGMLSSITAIVDAVKNHQNFKEPGSTGQHIKHNLQDAVTSTFRQLAAEVNKSANMMNALLLEPRFPTNQKSSVAAYLDDALGVASTLHTNLKNALNDRTESTKSADKVDKAIEQVKNTLREQLSEDTEKPSSHVKLPTSGDKFQNYNGCVAQDDATLSALASGNLNNITESSGTLPNKIKDIDTHSLTYFEEKLGVKREVKNLSNGYLKEITDNLTQLMEAFSKAGRAVNAEFKKLQTNIGRKEHGSTVEVTKGSLQKIYDNLSNVLRDNVARVIQSATEFVKLEADKLKQNCTKSLTQHVNTESQQAIHKLITQARKLCISSMKSSLEQFSGKVTEELKPLPTLIDTDRQHGFKGFMRTLQGIIGENGETSDENIERLKGLVGQLSRNVNHKDAFIKLSANFKDFCSPLHVYLKAEIKRVHEANNEKINPKPSGVEQLYTSKLDAAHTALNNLLDHINTNNRYNHEVPALLDSLSTKVDSLHPKTFNDPNTPLLDGVGKGLREFAAELGKAYISAYDSETFGAELVEKDKLTPYGSKLSKVCLTVVSTSYNVLNTVRKYSGTTWKSDKIHQSTPIGQFLGNNGYVVSKDKQDGHLRHGAGMLGWHVYKSLVKNDDSRVYRHHDAEKDTGPLEMLHEILQTYYRIGHISTFSAKKLPCSIFEMLCWIVGLPCTSAYDEMLHDAVSDLFVDPSKRVTVGDLDAAVVGDEPVASYPEAIELERTQRAVKRLCSRSYDVLLEIVGYGNAYTTYAVDYCDNSLQLSYPSDPSQCLELLLDILRKLLPVFRFLHSQCKVTAEHRGWSDCWYGKGVQSSKSQCNDHASEKATCQPNDQPKCQARCQANCHPTSPLQSYLSDCLTGHLPHQVSSIGCKAKCATCPKVLPGQPCLTPLGFRGFSGSMKTGKDLCKVLTKFFFDVQYSSLLCLMPKPPSTLPEHYQFALTLGSMLKNGKGGSTGIVCTAFRASIGSASIRLYENPIELTNAFGDAYGNTHIEHSHRTGEPKHAPLSSLSMNNSCMLPKTDNIYCGPYLQSLYQDTYYSLAEKHCNLYLSWAIYLPWQFWNYLKTLYDSFCSISCQDWGCSGCLKGDKCKTGKHGTDYNCKCWSVVKCRGVQSTFYSYGFTFGDAKKLLDENELRYCHDFCKQLENILNSQFFKDLLQKCDEFIFTIRQPFIWLNVALWSLSLFYLICVMVGRLDVLHIKSHLRSPSSHKITAQSLLAAAQVGRLAKISYLRP